MGRDGEHLFNRVFGKESRLVVVLYRSDWGRTPWTRIEETAIRNRGHEEGYDFTFFLVLDTPPSAPAWLPRNRLWANFEGFGLSGAAAAIDSRLQEAGGTSRQETLEEKAARLRREEREDHERLAFLASKGTEMAAKEAVALLNVMAELAVMAGVRVERNDQRYQGCFHAGNFTVGVQWHPPPYINVVQYGRLGVTLWGAHYPLNPGIFVREQPREVRTALYQFDVTPRTHQPLWRPEPATDNPPLSTSALADKALRQLLDHIEQTRKKRR